MFDHTKHDANTSHEDKPSVSKSAEQTTSSDANNKQTQVLPQLSVTTDDAEEADLENSLAYKSLMEHRKKRRGKRIKRLIIGIAALIAVIAIVIAGRLAQQGTNSSSETTTATVTREDFTDTVSATGNAEPVSSVVVSPEVDGTIDQVDVKEGDTVAAGDVLFTIKNDSLDQAVSSASLQVKKDQNAVDAAQATLDEATTAASSSSTATSSSVEEAKTNLEAAQLTLESDQSSYDEAVSNADKRTVRASSAGTIIEMNAVSGQTVTAATGTTTSSSSSSTSSSSISSSSISSSSSQNLIEIADLSQMTVTVEVNEVDIPQIAVGQNATVTFSALSDVTCAATVQSIATVSSTSSSSSTTDTGVVTYAVDLLIPSPDARIKPGMTASVKIVSQQISDALCVPVSAIQTADDGSTYAVVVTGQDSKGNDITERRSVQVEAESSSTAVIESGLSEGDVVTIGSSDSSDSTTTDA